MAYTKVVSDTIMMYVLNVTGLGIHVYWDPEHPDLDGLYSTFTLNDSLGFI